MLDIIEKIKSLKVKDQMIIADSILNSFSLSKESEISEAEISEILEMETEYKKNNLFFTKEQTLVYV